MDIVPGKLMGIGLLEISLTCQDTSLLPLELAELEHKVLLTAK